MKLEANPFGLDLDDHITLDSQLGLMVRRAPHFVQEVRTQLISHREFDTAAEPGTLSLAIIG